MDTITHGILGGLIGKGYFSERYGKVATFAAVLGAAAPDADVVAEIFSRDPLGIVKYHRAITHSFVALPVFALLLALLTQELLPWAKRKWKWLEGAESPPLGILTLIYGIAIASHILLDGMTSFGTRMWYPISSTRVAWDLLFIIDLTFTAIILVPQVVAWVYPHAGPNDEPDLAKSRSRAIKMWVIFSAGTFAGWGLTRAAGYPFRLWVAGVVVAILAIVFFAPAAGGWGFRVTRAAWCQGGMCLMVAYILGCAVAHHSAILRAKVFADQNHIEADRLGALPIPPSLLDWGDAIRSPEGLYESQFDLRQSNPVPFRFVPDTPPDPFVARAFLLANVRLYWQFARFPSIVSFVEPDGRHIVELGENRFSDGRRRGPQPFTYQVVFDKTGRVLDEGWLTNGMLQRGVMETTPQDSMPPSKQPKQTP
jgi:membrane-bound metal-dependent hydrolase YbcI (DUF457 family)